MKDNRACDSDLGGMGIHSARVGRVYDIKKDWYHSTGIKIRIIKAYRHRLEDITPDEAFKEGGYSIKEFISIWKRINGSWDPNEEVLGYKFNVINEFDRKPLNDYLRS